MTKLIKFKRVLASLLAFIILAGLVPVSVLSPHPAKAAEVEVWNINDSACGDPWIPYPAADPSAADPEEDQQTGQASRDIVGGIPSSGNFTNSYPPSYLRFLDLDGDGVIGDAMAVRIRLNAADGGTNDSNFEFKSFAYIGMDIDGDGKMDLYLGAYSPTSNNGRLGIYLADPLLVNTAPGNSGVTKPIASFQPRRGENFSFIRVDYEKDQYEGYVDEGFKGFSQNPDYFITFVFTLSDINNALAKVNAKDKDGNLIVITPATPFTYVIGTATQDNSLNGDINGMRGITNDPWPPVPPISTDGIKFFTVTFNRSIGEQDANPQFFPFDEIRDETGRGTGVAIADKIPPINPKKRATDGGFDSHSQPIVLTWTVVGWTTTYHYDSAGNLLHPTTGAIVDTVDMTDAQIKALFAATWFNTPATINKDTTVYAVWKANTSEVSATPDEIIHFDGNGGGWPNVNGVTYRDEMSIDGNGNLPPNPVYGNGTTTTTFVGWSTIKMSVLTSNAPAINSVQFYYWSEPIAKLSYVPQTHGTQTAVSERTAYAVWWTPQNQNGRSVSCYDNIGAGGGKLLCLVSVAPSSLVSSTPPNPERQGFAFRGWSTNVSGTGTRYGDPKTTTSPAITTADITTGITAFYAIWEPSNYAVEFRANNVDISGQGLSGAPTGTFDAFLCPVINNELRYPAFPEVPSLPGYTFIGWNTDPGGFDYWVRWDNIKGEYVGDIIIPGGILRYTLLEKDSAGIGEVRDVLIKNKKLTGEDILSGYKRFYAIWEREPYEGDHYDVTFRANGISISGAEETGGEFMNGNELFNLKHPDLPQDDPESYETDATPGVLKVTIDPETGKPDQRQETITGESWYAYYAPPEKPGYTFAGWSYQPGPNRRVAFFHPSAMDQIFAAPTVVYAVWTPVPETYKVVFSPNEGLWPDADPAVYFGDNYDPVTREIAMETDYFGIVMYVPYSELTVKNPGEPDEYYVARGPERESFRFMGWNTKPNGSGDEFWSDTEVEKYADYIVNETVTVENEDGTTTTVIEKKLYVYAQWASDDPDMTVLAFFHNDGSFGNAAYHKDNKTYFTNTVLWPQGKPVTEPVTTDCEVKDGWTFVGWFKDDAGKELWNFDVDTADLDPTYIYAGWDVGVTFSLNYAGAENAGLYEFTYPVRVNNAISAPELNPTRDGYVFHGWYRDADCTKPWIFKEDEDLDVNPKIIADLVTEPTTIYAKWNQTDAWTPVAIKFSTGKLIKAEQFEFTLYNAAIDDQTVPGVELWIEGGIVGTARNTAAGHIYFDKIEYTAEGVYYYIMKETACLTADESGWTLSKDTYYITVTVTDTPEGLEADVVSRRNGLPGHVPLTFTNSYVMGAELELLGRKDTGDWTGYLSGGEFSFTAKAIAAMPMAPISEYSDKELMDFFDNEYNDTIATGTNDEYGNISFDFVDVIKYTSYFEGTWFMYMVAEDGPLPTGWTNRTALIPLFIRIDVDANSGDVLLRMFKSAYYKIGQGIVAEGYIENLTQLAEHLVFRNDYSDVPTYLATLSLTLDDSALGGETIGLYQDGSLVSAMTDHGNGDYTATLVDGTYDIYRGGADTGEKITVSGAAASKTLAYWTLTLDAGTGIGSVSGGGEYLAGTSVDISATVNGGYVWSKWLASPGEFGDVLTQDTDVTMPSNALTLTATAIATVPTYLATVYLTLDESASVGETIELYQGDSPVGVMTDHGDGSYTATVPDGAYSIYRDGTDTGQTITVTGAAASKTLAYCTLTLNAGTGIASVSGGGQYLAGASVSISATVNDGYEWSMWEADPGEFVDVTEKSTSITMPDYPLTLTATATAIVPTYTATVILTLDGTAKDGETIELHRGGLLVVAMTDDGNGIYTATVPGGNYSIFRNGIYTYRTLIVSGDEASETLAYWTLTLDAGTGIDTVSGGGEYLAGTSVSISATVNSAYTWSKWLASPGGFGDVTAQSTAITTPSNALTLTATATAIVPTYLATVNVTLDSSALGGQTIELYHDGSLVVAMTGQGSGSYTATVPDRTYNIYRGGTDTGQTITVSGAAASETLAYFTLTLNVGTGIASVSGGGEYLAGTSVGITATVNGGYEWSKWLAVPVGFGDVTAQNPDITIPEYALTLTANATETPQTYLATVNLTVDGSALGGEIIQLHQGGSLIETMTDHGNGSYTATLADGEYDIYRGGAVTGQTITVSGAAASKTLAYWTLTLNTGTGIDSVSGGGEYLAGTSVNITATVNGEYEWSKWKDTNASGFGDVDTQDTTITTPGYPLTLTATATAIVPTYTATVTLTLDNSALSGQTISLYQDASLVSAMADQGNGSYTATLPDGIYSIYRDGADTGEKITVSGAATSKTLAYWTLTLDAVTGIASVSGGGEYLAGTSVGITATVNGGYEWDKWLAAPVGFGDVTAQNTAIMMPGNALTLTATATAIEPTYLATVSVTVDSTAKSAETIELYQDGSLVVTMTGQGSGSYTATVVDGTYNIYRGGADTGQTITVSGAAASKTLAYFTLTLNVGTGIGAVSGGGEYLAGTSVNITATVNSGYAWSKWEDTNMTEFGDVTAQSPAITMPGYPLTLKATATAIVHTYLTTVDLKLDGSALGGEIIQLHQGGSLIETMTGDGNGSYTATLVSGTYNIYRGGTDTGQTITVSGAAASKTLAYWTLTLNAGIGIGMVSGGGQYLTGTSVSITAIVNGGYVWNSWVAAPNVFGDVGTQNTAITMPGYTLALTATATATSIVPTHLATVSVTVDGSAKNGETIALYQNGSMVVSMTGQGNGSYTATLADGIYSIYRGGKDTGQTITVNGASVSKTLAYWTLTVNAGTGIGSANGGGEYFAGTSVGISATVNDGYVWSNWEDTNATGFGVKSMRVVNIIMPGYKLTLTATATAVPPLPPKTYTVTVTVERRDDYGNLIELIDGVKVTLEQGGSTLKGPNNTDLNGRVVWNDVPPGNYELSLEKALASEDIDIIRYLDVDDDVAITIIVLEDEGRLNTQFERKADVRAVWVLNLDKVFDNAVKDHNNDRSRGVILYDIEEVYDNGGKVTVYLVARNVDDGDPIQNDQRQQIKDVIDNTANRTFGFDLDLSAYLEARASNQALLYETPLDELNNLVEIHISLDAFLWTKTIYVYRHHDGVVQEIKTTPNADGEYFRRSTGGDEVILVVKKFSNYTVAYNTSSVGNPPVITPGSPGSPGQPNLPNLPNVIPPDQRPKTTLLNTENHFAYIIGFPDGRIGPNEMLTCEQAVTIFFRLLKDDVRNENLSTYNVFHDMSENRWSNTAVSTLARMGIITGHPNGNFRPGINMTRAEFVTLAARFLSYNDESGSMPYSDVSADHWAAVYIMRAYNAGLIIGDPGGTFRPDEPIRRAEAISVINRLLNRRVATIVDMLPDMITWIDNDDPTAWYYYDVQEATNSHGYVRNEDNGNETWETVFPPRDWTEYERDDRTRYLQG